MWNTDIKVQVNKYSGKCTFCKEIVESGQGLCFLHKNMEKITKYVVAHASCFNENKDKL